MEETLKQYEQTFGEVPANIHQRLFVAEQAQRQQSIEVIEAMRKVLLTENPLGPKLQQLVHFAMLIGAEAYAPARLHAKAALKAGATASELFGVCETAAVIRGMPGFSEATKIVYEVLRESEST